MAIVGDWIQDTLKEFEKMDNIYDILYKHPKMNIYRHKGMVESRLFSFKGICENFTPSGKCVFKNSKEQLLVVHYEDIIQMKPVGVED